MDDSDLDNLVGPKDRVPMRRLGRYLASAPSRIWNNLTKEKIVNGIKALAWVGPLTILIWIYAEREQTGNPKWDDVSITFISNNPQREVRPSSGGQVFVQLALQGPQGGLDKVRSQLFGVPRGLEIDLGNSLGKGRGQNVNIVKAISDYSIFKSNGVSVIGTTPSEVPVDVDIVREIDLPIEIPPDADNLTSATVFEPRQVKVRGPESVILSGQLKARAVIPDSAKQLQPGQQPPIIVPVRIANGSVQVDGLTITPSTVKATLDVKAADVEDVLGSAIPINVQASLDTLKNNDVVLSRQAIPSLHIIGPRQQVELLKKNPHLARAVLEVGTASNRTDEPRTLRYEFSPEVKDVHAAPEDAGQTVNFHLARREAPASE